MPRRSFRAGSAHPKAASLVHEVGHLGGKSSEPGARTDDDGVVGGKIVNLRDWRGLIYLVVKVARNTLRYELRNPLHVDLCAGVSSPVGDGRRHCFDMAVRRVVENQNLRHNFSTGCQKIDSEPHRVLVCRGNSMHGWTVAAERGKVFPLLADVYTDLAVGAWSCECGRGESASPSQPSDPLRTAPRSIVGGVPEESPRQSDLSGCSGLPRYQRAVARFQ